MTVGWWWVDGDWVDGNWAEDAGPMLAPGYWAHDYWVAGYWDPHYWGPGVIHPPGGPPHRKVHVFPSLYGFVVPESEVRQEIRAAITKAAEFEEQRQLREHEGEEWQRREYYRKLGLRGVEVKQEKRQEEETRRTAALRNLAKAREVAARPPAPPPTAPPPIPDPVVARLAAERTRAPRKPDVNARIEQLETRLATVQNALDQLNAERERQEQIKRERLGNLKKARKPRK